MAGTITRKTKEEAEGKPKDTQLARKKKIKKRES
jgi:hypothetical protein